MINLPPTQDNLHQHIKKSIYQASIWVTTEFSNQNVPCPEYWDWQKDDCLIWKPILITLTATTKECRDVLNIKSVCKSES